MLYVDYEMYAREAVAEHERQVAAHQLRALARAAHEEAGESRRRWPRKVRPFGLGRRRATPA